MSDHLSTRIIAALLAEHERRSDDWTASDLAAVVAAVPITVGASVALEEVFPDAPRAAGEESAWLVETRDGLTQATCYLSVTPTGFRWTESPNAALRFARRFDAEGVLPSVRASQSNPATPVHAREHIWCDQ